MSLYPTAAILLILTFLVVSDRNIADYLYLRLFSIPLVWIRTKAFQLRLLIPLLYERFLLKRGIIPGKYVKMAEEIRSSLRK